MCLQCGPFYKWIFNGCIPISIVQWKMVPNRNGHSESAFDSHVQIIWKELFVMVPNARQRPQQRHRTSICRRRKHEWDSNFVQTNHFPVRPLLRPFEFCLHFASNQTDRWSQRTAFNHKKRSINKNPYTSARVNFVLFSLGYVNANDHKTSRCAMQTPNGGEEPMTSEIEATRANGNWINKLNLLDYRFHSFLCKRTRSYISFYRSYHKQHRWLIIIITTTSRDE